LQPSSETTLQCGNISLDLGVQFLLKNNQHASLHLKESKRTKKIANRCKFTLHPMQGKPVQISLSHPTQAFKSWDGQL